MQWEAGKIDDFEDLGKSSNRRLCKKTLLKLGRTFLKASVV
jgi:hypothetical protein